MTSLPPPVEDTQPSKGAHSVTLLIAGALGAFLIWAQIGTLDVVSMVSGEVMPSGQVRSVQHLEGGIVREILVREGDPVEQDQPLLRLEPTARAADAEEVRLRIASLQVDILRLEAEAAQAPTLTFSQDFMDKHGGLIKDATDHFQARKAHRDALMKTREQEVSQREKQIEDLTRSLSNRERELAIAKEQVAISARLREQELSTRMKHLELLKESQRLQGMLDDGKADLAQAKSELDAAQLQVVSFTEGLNQELRMELEENRRSLEELTSRAAKFEDNLERTVLRSPVKGLVQSLYITTTGGVISPGGTVMDIVPSGERLVVEGRMPPQEIVYVKAGQSATVQLASPDAIRFGKIEGEVRQVSPDTVKTRDGQSFYRVRIELDRDHFLRDGERYALAPGVQIIGHIRTGERTVLSYLLDPFLTSTSAALRER